MTNEGAPGCAPARAKQILWSPWGKLPPRGGGGLPQGGDDDDEHLSRQVRKAVKNNHLPRGVGSGALHPPLTEKDRAPIEAALVFDVAYSLDRPFYNLLLSDLRVF